MLQTKPVPINLRLAKLPLLTNFRDCYLIGCLFNNALGEWFIRGGIIVISLCV